MEFLPFVYDALAVSMLLYHIYVASKRGLAATVANFVGYIAALAVASLVAKTLSPVLFSTFFRPELITRIQTGLDGLPGGAELADSAAAMLSSLPDYVGDLMNIGGYNAGELAALLESYSANTAGAVVDAIVAPVITGMMNMVLFLVSVSVLMVVVHGITHFFYGVNRVPVIGFLNSVFGGVLGLAMGVIGIYVVAVVLRFVLTFTGASISFLTQDILEKTYSYRLLASYEPFGFL